MNPPSIVSLLAAVLLPLAVTPSVQAQTFELLSLEKGKPTDAKTAPVITQLSGWEIRQDPTPSLVLPDHTESESQSAQCTLVLPPDLRTKPFTLSFSAEVTGGGWIGSTLRGTGAVPLPWFGVGRGALGHANAQTADSERIDLPRLSADSPSQFVIKNSPQTRTFEVSIDGAPSVTVPYPEALEAIASITFSLTAKDSRASTASISNPTLTFQE